MSLSQLHLNYERVLKLREEAQTILQQYPEKRVQAFTGSLEALLEELSVFQIELEMQNEELRDLQQKLEQSQADYRTFYHAAPVAILTLTPNGYLQHANPMAIQLLQIEKLSRMPLDKITLTPMLHPDELQAFVSHLRSAAAGQTVREVFHLRGDRGSETEVTFHSKSLLEENESKSSFESPNPRVLSFIIPTSLKT